MFFLNAKVEREERVRNLKQCPSIPALNIPKAKSQAQSLPFLCLFKIRIPFVLFLDRKKERKGCHPTKVSRRLKSAFQVSVNGNCFPSLKTATFKLTMWGKQNHKYELLFRQQTASIWSLSPLPLGIHMPQSS